MLTPYMHAFCVTDLEISHGVLFEVPSPVSSSCCENIPTGMGGYWPMHTPLPAKADCGVIRTYIGR